MSAFIHTHSIRLLAGQEALVTRVVSEGGKVGFGFSLRLDATEARHMAECEAGIRNERPRYQPALNHPWEKAWISRRPVEWKLEPAFARITWLSLP